MGHKIITNLYYISEEGRGISVIPPFLSPIKKTNTPFTLLQLQHKTFAYFLRRSLSHTFSLLPSLKDLKSSVLSHLRSHPQVEVWYDDASSEQEMDDSDVEFVEVDLNNRYGRIGLS
ncbi:uncharacterized protein [Spinacia oleracea]|uniref:Uncharacterized protein n=1 Tax=Spinacia oleracea TaxID=3562 RepID=A0ABM3QSH4_SPIOL|nr:uncharacterized protein LOC110775017 [Spinacia oleracea]